MIFGIDHILNCGFSTHCKNCVHNCEYQSFTLFVTVNEIFSIRYGVSFKVSKEGPSTCIEPFQIDLILTTESMMTSKNYPSSSQAPCKTSKGPVYDICGVGKGMSFEKSIILFRAIQCSYS